MQHKLQVIYHVTPGEFTVLSLGTGPWDWLEASGKDSAMTSSNHRQPGPQTASALEINCVAQNLQDHPHSGQLVDYTFWRPTQPNSSIIVWLGRLTECMGSATFVIQFYHNKAMQIKFSQRERNAGQSGELSHSRYNLLLQDWRVTQTSISRVLLGSHSWGILERIIAQMLPSLRKIAKLRHCLLGIKATWFPMV